MELACPHGEVPVVHQIGALQAWDFQRPVFDGKQYEVDVIIYATGFQYMTTGTFNSILGRNGLNLKD